MIFGRFSPAAGLVCASMGVMLSACGGPQGSGSESTTSGSTPPLVVTIPTPTASQREAQICAPGNPFIQDALAITSAGSLSSEKRWVRAYMDEAYLWYDEIPPVDATAPPFSNDQDVYGSLENYFGALKTPVLTASGKRKDQFSFVFPTRAWRELSQSGTVLGYGMEIVLASSIPPRGIRVAYVEPGSPADQAGVQRGDTLVSANGVPADTLDPAGIDVLNAALSPATPGLRTFVFSRKGMVLPALSLGATTVVKQPVLAAKVLDVEGQKVGYLVFNDHIASAEAQLIAAVRQFKAAGVSDLVLDLRYNGGGFLFIASELSTMIAGTARTQGKIFERLQFNNKRAQETEEATQPFFVTACGLDSSFRCTTDELLPTLNLPRVFVLVTGSTCSASESIINSLRGVDLEVRVIGTTTCGKPYGFSAKDNCGISYFPIEFQGTNHKGFGDYADGFAPDCPARDDLDSPLGDVREGMLAAALYNRTHNACQPGSAAGKAQADAGQGDSEGFLQRGAARENRIYLPGR